jgi:sporulation protein YlmC with PRC-barrel domain
MHVRLGDLSGRLVLDATGAILGRTRAPLVDLETWVIDGLRVTLSRHAAAEFDVPYTWWAFWKWPTIDVPTGVVQAAGDAILLRVSLGDLREHMPELHVPGTTEAAHPPAIH